MRTLYESVLRPDQTDRDISRQVELMPLLKKYHWFVKSARWDGDTVKLVFDGRGYMDDFERVAEELQCCSFDVYPWAIISGVKKLDGFALKAATRLDIRCDDIQNCKLIAGHRVTIRPDKTKIIKMVRNSFETHALRLNNFDRTVLASNNFNQIEQLTIDHFGSKVNNIVLNWNVITQKDNKWVTYPRPTGQPDPSIDPLRTLGIDKHFKNLDNVKIALNTGGDDCYIDLNSPSANYRHKQFDWGVDKIVDYNNGWQLAVIRDARCI